MRETLDLIKGEREKASWKLLNKGISSREKGDQHFIKKNGKILEKTEEIRGNCKFLVKNNPKGGRERGGTNLLNILKESPPNGESPDWSE